MAYKFKFEVEYTIKGPIKDAKDMADQIADRIDEAINGSIYEEFMDVLFMDSFLDEGAQACPECGSTNFDERPDNYYCNDCYLTFSKE